MNVEIKKIMECGTIRSRDADVDSERQKIRSLCNEDMENS